VAAVAGNLNHPDPGRLPDAGLAGVLIRDLVENVGSSRAGAARRVRDQRVKSRAGATKTRPTPRRKPSRLEDGPPRDGRSYFLTFTWNPAAFRALTSSAASKSPLTVKESILALAVSSFTPSTFLSVA